MVAHLEQRRYEWAPDMRVYQEGEAVRGQWPRQDARRVIIMRPSRSVVLLPLLPPLLVLRAIVLRSQILRQRPSVRAPCTVAAAAAIFFHAALCGGQLEELCISREILMRQILQIHSQMSGIIGIARHQWCSRAHLYRRPHSPSGSHSGT